MEHNISFCYCKQNIWYTKCMLTITFLLIDDLIHLSFYCPATLKKQGNMATSLHDFDLLIRCISNFEISSFKQNIYWDRTSVYDKYVFLWKFCQLLASWNTNELWAKWKTKFLFNLCYHICSFISNHF
jgi:hypothetical protein